MAPPIGDRHARPAAIAPLAGYTVVVATDRRRHPLADLLESIGARTIGVQAVRSMAQPPGDRLREATESCLAHPLDEVVISSALGLRCWLAAARHWGMADQLLARFGAARLLARDPRSADSLRELGFMTIWSTATTTTEDLLRYLAAQPTVGRRMVVQLDKASLREPCHALREAGAEVVEAPTYQTSQPAHADILRRLADQIVKRQVDAVALVGEEATHHLLERARVEQVMGDMLNALCEDVLCAGLGSLTAAPLLAQGVPTLVGAAPYAEDLVRLLATTMPQRAVFLNIDGHRLEIRGQAVVLNDRLIPIQSGPIAVLRVLARQPGRVLSCAEIRRAMPTWSAVDDHAIEMAVFRLRRALEGTDLVHTIIKRGYRLAW